MTNKDKYHSFCQKNNFVPLFSMPWWMDAVCENGYWDVLIYEKGDEVVGALPYYAKKKLGISYITQPPFTQNNGVVIKYPLDIRQDRKLSFEKEVMTSLIEDLEKLPFDFYHQTFNHSYTNWLPFYWKGFNQTTLYTYKINDISNINNVISSFETSKRSDLKCAHKNFFSIDYEMPIDEFYIFHNKTLKKLGKTILYSLSAITSIYNAAKLNNSVCIISVKDNINNIHSAIMLVWDKTCAYNLITSIDPDFRSSRSSMILFVKAIEYASKFVNSFDFEGSVNETIESSYRKMGTVQTPYFYIFKYMTKNPIIKLIINRKMRQLK